MKVKAILNIKVDEDGKVSVSVDTDTEKDVSEKDVSEKDVSEKDVSEKDVSEKIKLVNRNAKTIKEAYGLTDEDLKKFIEEFKKIDRNNLDSIKISYEHVIPLVYSLNGPLLECALKIMNALRRETIENKIDLIEVVCNAANDINRKKYMKILLDIYNWWYV